MQELRPIWRPQYASGHEALDQEHQALFRKLEDFLALLEQEGTRDQARAFDLLVGECATHFGHEEAMLKSAGYPDLDRHAALHALLLSKCEQLRGSIPAPQAMVELMAGRLSELIVAHILTADLHFYPYLNPAHHPHRRSAHGSAGRGNLRWCLVRYSEIAAASTSACVRPVSLATWRSFSPTAFPAPRH
jgi:hemerythrin-like metal-binding protein